MRVTCFELEPWERDLFHTAFPDDLTTFEEALKQEHLAQIRETEVLAVFIYSRVTREVISELPNLKLICTLSTGFDHIDLVACKERNILVCNVPTYGERTVAQHTFALLLALTRKLVPSVDEVRKGSFVPTPTLRGRDIDSMTIGVIGTGRIGRNVIAIANGFHMRVLAYDPYPQQSLETELNFRYVALDELFERCDIVTLHVPFSPATKHLIDAAAIAKMKRGVMLLNTSRGGLIETAALYSALQSGQVGAAGLDVLEEEVAIKEEKQLLAGAFQQGVDYRTVVLDHLLIQLPNVIVTPHNAFNSQEALTRIVRTSIENVQTYTRGTPQNVVSNK